MPRSLFNVMSEEEYSEMEISDSSHYTWLPQVKALPIGDWCILVNPNNGGWAAFDKNEYHLVKNGLDPQQAYEGEFLYQVGLCARNGQAKNFVQHSDFTEQLYFFEFAVTSNCNLACAYCFTDARPTSFRGNATVELAELFIDRIAEYRANIRSQIPFTIEFSGGEPLMNFKVIRHTIEYAENEYGELLNTEFVIQSNLTLLTSKILEFIIEHKVSVGVSCDGFRAVHDKQRPFADNRGSHRLVETNMIKLRGLYPEKTGSVITVITQESVNKMPEIALYLYLCGFREIIMRPMAEVGRGATGHSKAPFARSYVKGLFDILNSVITPIYHETGELIEERFLSLTFQHLFHPYRAFMCERSPCGAARNICVLLPNGDVYPCNQSIDDEQLLLGNIKTSSFKELLKSVPAQVLSNRVVDQIIECQTCTFKSWCGSPCPHASFRKYGDLMAKSPECDIFMSRYKRVLRGLLEDEFDLSVVGKLAGCNTPIRWLKPYNK